MIDQLEGMNIRDFVVGDPVNRAEPLFDPMKDIPESAWKVMNKAYNHAYDKMIRNSEEAPGAIRIAADMKLLSGDDPSRLPRMNDRDWDILYTASVRNHHLYDGILSSIRIFDPERAKEERFQPSGSFYVSDYEHTTTQKYFQSVADVRIASPETEVEINQTRFEQLQGMIDRFKELTNPHLSTIAIERAEIWQVINAVKLVDPELAKEFSVQMKVPKDRILQELDALTKLNDPKLLHHVPRYAAELLLFQAEELKITENGLEIVKPTVKEVLNRQTEMPEVRKF